MITTGIGASEIEGGVESGAVKPLAKVRGWLLVFTVLLIPHIVLSALILVNSWPLPAGASLSPPGWGIEHLRLITQLITLVGHTTGVALIVIRHRYAPAFFTLYIPVLFLLFLLDPDIMATQVAHAERLGFEGASDPDLGPAQAQVRTIFSLVLSVVVWGYWLRSKRVEAVFGRNGLGFLHTRVLSRWGR